MENRNWQFYEHSLRRVLSSSQNLRCLHYIRRKNKKWSNISGCWVTRSKWIGKETVVDFRQLLSKLYDMTSKHGVFLIQWFVRARYCCLDECSYWRTHFFPWKTPAVPISLNLQMPPSQHTWPPFKNKTPSMPHPKTKIKFTQSFPGKTKMLIGVVTTSCKSSEIR